MDPVALALQDSSANIPDAVIVINIEKYPRKIYSHHEPFVGMLGQNSDMKQSEGKASTLGAPYPSLNWGFC
jgi:hypothetical protein